MTFSQHCLLLFRPYGNIIRPNSRKLISAAQAVRWHMKFDTIKYEKRCEIAWLTLNRPEAMNSLTPQLGDDFSAALAAAQADDSVRALVITGSPPAFCAGAELKFIGGQNEDSFTRALGTFLERLGRVFSSLETSMLPSIAAVNGPALAGGLELLLCCDLVVAASSAKIGDAHTNYGLLPGGGSTVRLPRKIGPTRAKYLLYAGEFLPAEELLACGLVNRVVADDKLAATVQAFAEKIAQKKSSQY